MPSGSSKLTSCSAQSPSKGRARSHSSKLPSAPSAAWPPSSSISSASTTSPSPASLREYLTLATHMRPANCLPIDSATLSGESSHAVSASTLPSGMLTLMGSRGSAAVASACLAAISEKMVARAASAAGSGAFLAPGAPSFSPAEPLLFGPLDAIVRLLSARPAAGSAARAAAPWAAPTTMPPYTSASSSVERLRVAAILCPCAPAAAFGSMMHADDSNNGVHVSAADEGGG